MAAPSEGHRQQVQTSEHSRIGLSFVFSVSLWSFVRQICKGGSADEHSKENANFKERCPCSQVPDAHLGSLEEFEEKDVNSSGFDRISEAVWVFVFLSEQFFIIGSYLYVHLFMCFESPHV